MTELEIKINELGKLLHEEIAKKNMYERNELSTAVQKIFNGKEGLYTIIEKLKKE